MSNMTADVTLLYESDSSKLQNVRNYLTCENDLIYVHESHRCPSPNHIFFEPSHIKLVVYSHLFFQDLVAIVIDHNAGILPEDVDINVALDTTPANIGWCACNMQTQPTMNGVPR